MGKMRRSLGQKQGEWTKEMNDRFMAKLDSSGDGKLEMAEFSQHFHGALPMDRAGFDHELDNFMKVAEEFSGKQKQKDIDARAKVEHHP